MQQEIKNHNCLLIFIICLLLTVPVTSNAFNDNNNITMITMDQIPYGFRGTNGRTTGVLYDILNEIMIESGIEKKNEVLSPMRLIATMTTKNNVCTLVADTPEVISMFDVIEPIGYQLTAGILPRVGATLLNYSSLRKLTIAVPLGNYINEKFNNDNKLSIMASRNYSNAINLLKTGQVDAIAGAISTIRFVGKKEGMKTTDFGQPLLFSQNDIQLVCTKGLTKKVRRTLKNAVLKLKSNGEIQKIINGYFDKKLVSL
jgi:ABC-type amino acid transport substrate-binding protein